MLIPLLLVWLLLSIGSSFSFTKVLVWGNHWCHLPIFFSVFRSLCLFYFLNLDQVSIQHLFSAIFHTVKLQFSVPISISFFCVPCFSIESLRVPSCPMRQQCFSLCIRSSPPLQSQVYQFPHQGLLQMSLHYPRHLEILCSVHRCFRHQCYILRWCQHFHFLLWAQYFSIFLYFLLVWIMNRSILRCVDWIILSCSLFGVHVPVA